MTNNEAAKWIQLYIDLAKIDPTTGEEAYLNDDDKKMIEAMEMAVNTLIREVCNADKPTCNQLATNLQPCKQDDLISRSDVIDMLKREEKILYSPAWLKYLVRAIEALPSIQPEKRTQERTETHSCDLISRLSEIRSQYNCFNESEEPYYRALSEVIKMLSEQADGDTISRQAANEQKAEESLLRTDDKSVSKDDVIYRADAIRTAESFYRISEDIRRKMAFELRQLPPAQPEQTDCEYCHEDIDGYVRPIEKNSHAWLVRRGRTMKLRVCFNGGYRECDILFCPMCGRRLTDEDR